MHSYMRVIPRDLFNESGLLFLYGRLVIVLGETAGLSARFEDDAVPGFDIEQDQSSGMLTIANLHFSVRGVRHMLQRPLNSKDKWSFWLTNPNDPNFDEIAVFDGEGNLSAEMLSYISATEQDGDDREDGNGR